MTHEEMTPEQQAAYDAARAEIAQAKADGTTELEPTGGDHENLVTLPPEIGELSALRELDLSQLPLTDLTPLAGLSALQSLNLRDTQVTDLAPLAGLSALQSLDLNSTQVTDLSPLAGLSALQRLDLFSTQVTDLTPLAGLSELQSLVLVETPLTDLAPLAELSAMQSLHLTSTQVTDLTPLSGLSALQSLNLNGTQVTDLAPLAEFSAMQSLHLNSTQVTDLTPLAGLTALQNLYFRGTLVTDLSPLAGLSALQSLTLSSTKVTDLSPLAGLATLQRLNLWGTQVTDVSPLVRLTTLQSLTLTNTQVTDLAPLAGLSELQVLYLAGTQVTDLAPLGGLSALQSLALKGTLVTDLRPLLTLDLLWDKAGEYGPRDPEWGLWFEDTPATEADPTLKRLSEIEDHKERAEKTRAYLQTLPPYPEPLPWESGTEVEAPEQISALELVWTAEGFGFNSRPVPVADDPVAQATLEDLRDLLNELIRLAGNQHEDIYRRAEQLRDRITCDEIDLLKAHLAFQRLQRLYDQRGDRAAKLDDETTQTLQDVVETLPGLTLADDKVKDLLDRQAANRRDRADVAQVEAEIGIAKAMTAEGAPFDAEVKQVAEDGATDEVDDQLTRARPTLVKNAVIAVGKEFKAGPTAVTTAVVGTSLAVEGAHPGMGAWLATYAETILLAAAQLGARVSGLDQPDHRQGQNRRRWGQRCKGQAFQTVRCCAIACPTVCHTLCRRKADGVPTPLFGP